LPISKQQQKLKTYLALEGLGNLGDGVGDLVGLIAWLDQPQSGLAGQVSGQYSISLPSSHLGSKIGSGSVTLWIRIRIGNPDPDPGARKLINFSGKMHFLVIFKKILPLKRYKIALTTVLFEKNVDE
jgi:hypothetical protein